ncbi:MAG TPA: hypothetical protein VFQ61_11365, partial [Polyangiaceae bacterium]|nr:hypothetical protein [Polyangiaceae bacterium]
PPPSSRSQSPTPPPAIESHASTHSVAPTNGASVRPVMQSFRPSQPAPEIRNATPPAEHVGQRAAARVSVLTNSDQPGLFTVRVLADGEGVQAPAVEAFLVFSEPNVRISR